MSEPRRLWMRFREVPRENRGAYREAVIAAGVTAGSMGSHFWAFETDGDEGRFVEFLEGPSDEVLGTLLETTFEPLGASSGQSAASGLRVGPDGLRCTEVV